MSTDYRLHFKTSDGTEAEITIIDSINPLPGSDTWKADDRSQWDTAGGTVSNWGGNGVYLTGPLGPNSLFLDEFKKGTKVGDSSTGQKNYSDGSFPEGNFRWECTSKS